VSWLKKNELEVKRTMAELRDSIKANWSTTGQELTKDFRQFWQPSRPASPTRTPTQDKLDGLLTSNTAAAATSPTTASRLGHLDVPRVGGGHDRGSSDFAAGYNLGLLGGVRAWVRMSKPSENKFLTSTDGPQSAELERQQAGEPVRPRELRRTWP
jgi:choline-phosphate cytidylyltransferase